MPKKNKHFRWKLSKSGLYISFLRLSPGKESDFLGTNVKKSESKTSHNKYYKCIGIYDIVEILEITDLNKEFIYKTDPDLLDIVSIPCFSWNDTSLSKNFFEWSKGSPLLFLVMLKIDEKVFDVFKAEGERRVIEKLNTLLPDLSLHIGTGYNEIIAFYKTNDIESIFKLISKMRSLQINKVPAFVDTITLPLVSYNEVIDNINYKSIVGNLNIITKISCHPCMEKEIYDDLMKHGAKGIKVHDVLGENDLVIEWSSSTPSGSVINSLIDFRKRWGKKSGLYSTQTLLQKNKTTRRKTVCPEQINVFPKFFQIDLSSIQGIQRELGHENFDIFFVLNYVQDYLTKWNSIFSCPNYSSAFHDMLCFNFVLEARIVQYQNLLKRYNELRKSSDAPAEELFKIKALIANLEGYIIRLIEIANIGFGQRHVGLEASSSISKSILSTMFGGINRVAQAAAIIPDYLYSSGKEINYSYPWLGYIFFRQIYGYQVISEGEVISMPESSIFYPLFPGTHWLTLTHEIAHGFYFRLGLHKNKEFGEFRTEIKNYMKSAEEGGQDELFETLEVDLDAWELFSHWFDFKFIYDSDLDFYLWSIWSSWSQVPRVYQNFRDYLIRSVLIYICKNFEPYTMALREGKNHNDYLKKAFEYILTFLESINLGFPIPDLSSEEQKILFNKTSLFSYIIGFFEEKLNRAEIFPMPAVSNKVKEQVNKILVGEVIFDTIKNPILVLRELMRSIRENPNLSNDIGVNISLIYSFSNSARVNIRNKIKRPNATLIRKQLQSMIE